MGIIIATQKFPLKDSDRFEKETSEFFSVSVFTYPGEIIKVINIYIGVLILWQNRSAFLSNDAHFAIFLGLIVHTFK